MGEDIAGANTAFAFFRYELVMLPNEAYEVRENTQSPRVHDETGSG